MEKQTFRNITETLRSERRSWLWPAGFAAICIPAAIIALLCIFNDFYGSGIGDILDLSMDVLGSLVCVILYYGCMSGKSIRNSAVRAFIISLFLNSLTLMLDTAMWALSSGPALRPWNLIASTAFYTADAILFYQFWCYVRAVLQIDDGLVRRLDKTLRILLIPAIALCLTNLFFPVLFEITPDGLFKKASGYGLGYIYMLVTFIFIIAVLNKGKISLWKKISATVFSFFPIAAFVLTNAMPDIAIVYTVASISILLLNCVLFPERIRMKELIIRVFSLLLLCAMLLCGPVIYNVSLRLAAERGRERAAGAFSIITAELDKTGLDVLSDPADGNIYQSTRDNFRKICRAFGLQNLYVEKIDPVEKSRSFIIAVADSDELDQIVRETLGWPGASTWNENSRLTEPEKIAMTGEVPVIYSEENNEYGHNLDWFFPYRDAGGNVLAIIGADYEVQDQQIAAMKQTISNILPVLILYFATLVILIRMLGNAFIRPLSDISDHIQSFFIDGNAKKEPLSVWGGYEIWKLSKSFDFMTSELHEYEENLKRETAERERINTELNLAASIQANYLPVRFPPFPDRREFDIYAVMRPAKEVGGDFYDFFFIDPDHLALVTADVSGKGVPAALFMMISKTILKITAQAGYSPAGILEKVNEQLAADNAENMFVTVWLGILEVSSGLLTYADGGHEKPFLYQENEWKILPKKRGIPLGMFEPPVPADPEAPGSYKNQCLTLMPGDLILQYSDGVTEACSKDEKFFGESGLNEALSGASTTEPEELLNAVLKRIDAFAGDAMQFDDITLMCLRYNGRV